MRSDALVLLGLFLASRAAAQTVTIDSIRAELPKVVTVAHLPAGRDSAWVALVLRHPPTGLLLTQFDRDNPFFITYLLENRTTFDHHSFLASAQPGMDPRPEFYSRLGHDLHFMDALATTANAYAGRTAPHHIQGSQYSHPQILESATRFVLAGADTAGRLGYSICAKSWQLLDLPIPSDTVLEAWLYSIVRGGFEQGALTNAMASVEDVLTRSGPIRDSTALARVRRTVWETLLTNDQFRDYVTGELRRREAYLPFSIQK